MFCCVIASASVQLKRSDLIADARNNGLKMNSEASSRLLFFFVDCLNKSVCCVGHKEFDSLLNYNSLLAQSFSFASHM